MNIQERLQAIKELQDYLESGTRPNWRMTLNSREYFGISIALESLKHGDIQAAFDEVLSLLSPANISNVPTRLFYYLSFFANKLKDFKFVAQTNCFMIQHDDDFEVKQLSVLLNSLNRCRQYAKAIDIYHSFIEKQSAEVLTQSVKLAYAKALNGIGEHQAALDSLDLCDVNIDKESYMITKALCLRGLGRFEETIEIYKELEKSTIPNIKLYCARQYAYLGIYSRFDSIMEELLHAEPKNIALITEYLQCIAYKPNGRSKALTKCDEFLKTHSEDLSFEELKKLYLLQAWYSPKKDGISLYQQLCLRHPDDLEVLKAYIGYAMRHGLDIIVDELREKLSSLYQIEVDDILQRRLLKDLIQDNSEISLETSFSHQSIVLPEAIQEIMAIVQADTQDEIYLVGSTVIDLMTKQREFELKDVDLVCLSNRQVFQGFMPNPHIKNYYTRTFSNHVEYECGLVVMNSEHLGANFLRSNVLNRDFTICALFATAQGKVFDPTGKGFFDLHQRILRTVIDPKECLEAHPVRYLRAIKYLARGFFPDQELSSALSQFNVEVHLQTSHFMAALKSLLISPNYKNHLKLLANYQQLPIIMNNLQIPNRLSIAQKCTMMIERINQKMWTLQQSTLDVNLSDDKTLEYLQKQLADRLLHHGSFLGQFDRIYQHKLSLHEKISESKSQIKALTHQTQLQNEFMQQRNQIKEQSQELIKKNRVLKKRIEKKEESIQQAIFSKFQNISNQFREEKQNKTKELRRLDGQLLQVNQTLITRLFKNKETQQEIIKLEQLQEKISNNQTQKLAILKRLKDDLALAPVVEFKQCDVKHKNLFDKELYSAGQLSFETLYRFVTIPSLRKAMHLEIVRQELNNIHPNPFKMFFHLQSYHDFFDEKIPKKFKDKVLEREKQSNQSSKNVQECLFNADYCYKNLRTYEAHYYLSKALNACQKEHSKLLDCVFALAEFYMNQKDLILFNQLYQKYLKQFGKNEEFHRQFDAYFDQMRQVSQLYMSVINSDFPSRHQIHYWWLINIQQGGIYENVSVFENLAKISRSYLSGIYDASANIEELALVACLLNERKPLELLIDKSPEPSSLQFFKTWFDEHENPDYWSRLVRVCLENSPKTSVVRDAVFETDEFVHGLKLYPSLELKAMYDKTFEPLLASKIACALPLSVKVTEDPIPLFIYFFKAQIHLNSFKESLQGKVNLSELISFFDWTAVDTNQLEKSAENYLSSNESFFAEISYLMLLDVAPYSHTLILKLIAFYWQQEEWGSISKMLSSIKKLIPYFQNKFFSSLAGFELKPIMERIGFYQNKLDAKKQKIMDEIAQITQQIESLGEIVSLDSQYQELNMKRLGLYWDALSFYGEYSEEYIHILQQITQNDTQLSHRYSYAHLHLALYLQKENLLLASCHMHEAARFIKKLDTLYPEFNTALPLTKKLINTSFYHLKSRFFFNLMISNTFQFNDIIELMISFLRFGRPDLVFSHDMNKLRRQSTIELSPQLQFYLSLLLGQKSKALSFCESHPAEIIGTMLLGWSINPENIEKFFKNRYQFMMISSKPEGKKYHFMHNLYNEMIHTSILEGDLLKADLNFKLGLLRSGDIGIKLLIIFVDDYLENAKLMGHPKLIEQAIAFISEKKQQLPEQLLEYIKTYSSESENTASIKIGGAA
jgi:tRNA nucleotidyltransferase/poly(A) polymerase